MARLEYKYLVPTNLLSDLRDMVWPHVEEDHYSAIRPQHEYTVRSLYLDTSRLSFYHEKLAGLRERKKLRIRGYNECGPDALAFLEIKRKTGMAVVKYRTPVLHQNLLPLFASGDVGRYVPALPGQEEPRDNARRFLFHYHRLALHPSVLVTYEREAFLFKLDHRLRITFDKNVRVQNQVALNSLYKETQVRYPLPNHFILEIKTNSGCPSWLKLIISRFDLNQEALSKYVICTDSCHGIRYDPEQPNERPLNGFRL